MAVGRSLARLLRFLEAAGGSACIAGQMDGAIELAARGRVCRFPDEVCRPALSGRMMRIADGTAFLTTPGREKLRRLLHPDCAAGAKFTGQSARTAQLATGPGQAAVNLSESPLSRLFQRRNAAGSAYLSEAQFAAGEKLRTDFEKARLQPRISASWDRPVEARGQGESVAAELSDFALDARRRVEKALAALESELAGVALDICCFLKGFELVEQERRWPPRSAKLMLRTALSVLALHYGYVSRLSASKRPMLHWGAGDYRPAIAGDR